MKNVHCCREERQACNAIAECPIAPDGVAFRINADILKLAERRHFFGAKAVADDRVQQLLKEADSVPVTKRSGIFNDYWPATQRDDDTLDRSAVYTYLEEIPSHLPIQHSILK